RKPGGALGSSQDTNDNTSDFTLISSDPQNLVSPPTPNASPTPTPSPGPTLPTLSVNDLTLIEGDSGTSLVTFTVLLNAVSNQTISVDYATASGTAREGSDFQPTNGTLRFSPGETSHTIAVNINGDKLVEPDETISLNLSNPLNATISDTQGLGTIQNDDIPLLVISQVYGGGGNAGAIYKNDFVEICNRGTTTVDLFGWSIQQASSTGTSWSVTPLCS